MARVSVRGASFYAITEFADTQDEARQRVLTLQVSRPGHKESTSTAIP